MNYSLEVGVYTLVPCRWIGFWVSLLPPPPALCPVFHAHQMFDTLRLTNAEKNG